MFGICRYKHYVAQIGTEPPRGITPFHQIAIQKRVWDERNSYAAGKIAFMWLAIFNGAIAIIMGALAIWG